MSDEEIRQGPLTIVVEGLDELKRRLNSERLKRAAKDAVNTIAELVKQEMLPYPEEGEYNKPGPYPKKWYQRHFGPRWALKAGGVHGRDTSEQLQKRWVVVPKDAWSAYVGNKASYAPYVVGMEQQEYHKRHGWRRLDEVTRKVIETRAKQVFAEAIAKEIGGEP